MRREKGETDDHFVETCRRHVKEAVEGGTVPALLTKKKDLADIAQAVCEEHYGPGSTPRHPKPEA